MIGDSLCKKNMQCCTFATFIIISAARRPTLDLACPKCRNRISKIYILLTYSLFGENTLIFVSPLQRVLSAHNLAPPASALSDPLVCAMPSPELKPFATSVSLRVAVAVKCHCLSRIVIVRIGPDGISESLHNPSITSE